MKKIRTFIIVGSLVICAAILVYILVIRFIDIPPNGRVNPFKNGYTPIEGAPPPDILGRALLDEKNFLLSEKAWVGKTYTINNKERLLLTDTSADSAHLKGMFSDLGVQSGFKISADKKYVIRIYAEDVYYEVLDNPELLSTFKDNPSIIKSPYISGIMKAKKLQVELVDNREIVISTTLDIEKYANLDAGLSSENGVSAYRYAEDIIMGYKLQFPPENIDICTPPPPKDADLLFGFSAWQPKTGKWVTLLEEKDRNMATGDPEAVSELESGGMYKIRIKPLSGKYFVYIFNIDSKNIIYPVFPIYQSGIPDAAQNPFHQGSEVTLPNTKDEGYRLDSNTGTENFRVYFYREQNTAMETLVKFLNEDKNYGKYTDWKKVCEACKIGKNITGVEIKGTMKTVGTANNGQGSNYSLILADNSYYPFSFRHIASGSD